MDTSELELVELNFNIRYSEKLIYLDDKLFSIEITYSDTSPYCS